MGRPCGRPINILGIKKMAVIQHKSSDRTVANIAARNAISPRPDHLTVVVLDTIGDPQVLGGKAVYRWNETSQEWLLLVKENADSLTFTSESKTITNDSVTTLNVPASGIIWDVFVMLDETTKTIEQIETSVSGNTITVIPNTPGQFNGKKLHYKYAYGSIIQQLEELPVAPEITALDLEVQNLKQTVANLQESSGSVENIVHVIIPGPTVGARFNPNIANTFIFTLNRNYMLIFEDIVLNTNRAKEITFLIIQGTDTGTILNLGDVIAWPNGIVPRLSFGAGKIDCIRLLFIEGFTKPIGYYDGGWIDA